MEQVSGWAEQGGSVVTIPGTQGSGVQRFQQSFRGATVTVRDSSNNLATIYSDDLATPTAKANPFTASSTTGSWSFFTTTGTYSITFSGGSITAPFSITVNVGLGNAGGVPSYAFASLPTSKTQNAGDIARVTDTQRGLWMDTGTQWFSTAGLIVNVKEFNATGNGTTDDTTAIAAAIAAVSTAGGGVVFFPVGTYRTNTISLPTTSGVNLLGSGMQSTFLLPLSANQILLQATSTVDQSYVKGFTILAHPSGSTGAAINMSGFRFCVLEDIDFISNGAGDYSIGCILSSSPNGCYNNVLRRWVLNATVANMDTLVSFENNGTGSGGNANVIYLKNFSVYSCSGITTIIDARRSALVTIEDCLFEVNAAATAIIPGTKTVIKNNWFELNLADITPATGADGASNAVTVENNYFSTLHTVTIDSNYSDWFVANNTPSANFVLTDSGSINSIRLEGGTFSSTNANALLELKNPGAGGNRWGLTFNRTGGLFPTEFGIRDITGATTPVRIATGIPSSTLRITTTGMSVGVGTPDQKLHVFGATAFDEPATGITAFIANKVYGAVYWTSSGGTYPFNGNGNLVIQPRTSAGNDIVLATGTTTPSSRVIIDSVGNKVFGNAALATNATAGFIYITSSAGAPTGAPSAYTGMIPFHYDSSNNRLYAYNGSWRSVAVT